MKKDYDMCFSPHMVWAFLLLALAIYIGIQNHMTSICRNMQAIYDRQFEREIESETKRIKKYYRDLYSNDDSFDYDYDYDYDYYDDDED